MVLKQYILVGPLASGAIFSPAVFSGLGISETKGTTLPRNSIIRRTPISRNALTQNTGYMLRVMRPLRMPSRISSSVREPCSKNFSIRVSSFSAAASTNFWFNSRAFSISLSGISDMVGVPPSGDQLYIFMSRTSIMALNDGPQLSGYCTCTIRLPNVSCIWLITLS